MCAFSVVRVAINVFIPCSVGSQTTGYWSVFTLRGCGTIKCIRYLCW